MEGSQASNSDLVFFFRGIELVFSCIIVGVYYGTETSFSVDPKDSKNNFGEFVIFGGFVSAFVLLLFSFFARLEKNIQPIVIILYNAVWIIFYLAAALIIFFCWTSEDDSKVRRGGLTVGCFCLCQIISLFTNSVLAYVSSSFNQNIV